MTENLSVAHLLTGFGFIVTIVTNWVIVKVKGEHAEKENGDQWRTINALRNWQENHVKESSEKRLEIEREMGRIRENATNVLAKLDSLLGLVNDLIKKIDRLEERSR